jgi:protein-arginine kinase activator protein McsA
MLCVRCNVNKAELSIATAADEKTAEALCLKCAGVRLAESDRDWAARIELLTEQRAILENQAALVSQKIIEIQVQIDTLKAGGKALS